MIGNRMFIINYIIPINGGDIILRLIGRITKFLVESVE